jgi:condensin complex subunit 1
VLYIRDDPNEREIREHMFKTLLERAVADKNALTRSKALSTLSILACSRAIPHRLFARVAKDAGIKLIDKAGAVRRSALKLISCLIRNNPFGPSLNLVHFEKIGTAKAPNDASDDESSDSSLPGSPSQQNRISISSADSSTDVEDVSMQLKAQFYKSALDFIKALRDGVDKVVVMQRSSGVSEISEIVQVHVAAAEFEVEVFESAMRSMLPLFARNEAAVKESVVNGFELLMTPIGVGDSSDKDGALHVAGAFIKLLEISSYGEIHLLNGLLLDLVKRNPTLFDKVVLICCRIFQGEAASEREKCAAWILTGIISELRPNTLQSKLDTVIQVLSGKQSGYILRWACGALCKLPAGCDTEGLICAQITRIAEETIFIPAAEQAINAVYRLHPSPEGHLSSLLHRMECSVFQNPSSTSPSRVASFLFVVGHIAIKQIVRLESLLSEFQSESEAEKAMECAEGEIVSPQGMVGKYGIMLRKICTDSKGTSLVRASAVLCLSKLMSVQQKYCQQNMPIVLALLTCNEPTVRANAIIALGNLACRYPNIVEPFVAKLFLVLDDTDKSVRKNALMVLTHIALSGMIKFRSQMVDILVLINDREVVIAGLARHFFQELQTKSPNTAFNFLPECIKALSVRRDMEHPDKKKLISFLIGYIEKQWHIESMTEKLCHRFGHEIEPNERRLSAFAISQLSLTERCLSLLTDSYNLYSMSLEDEEILGCFVEGITKARRTLAQASTVGRKNNARTGADDTSKADELLERLERLKNTQQASENVQVSDILLPCS